jgi:hypothetical protein
LQYRQLQPQQQEYLHQLERQHYCRNTSSEALIFLFVKDGNGWNGMKIKLKNPPPPQKKYKKNKGYNNSECFVRKGTESEQFRRLKGINLCHMISKVFKMQTRAAWVG